MARIGHNKKETIVSYLDETMSETSKTILRLLFAQADNKDSEFTTDDIIGVLREVCATQHRSEKNNKDARFDR